MNEELARKQEPEEVAAADLPEGRSDGRRGETARQLIRRAKYASRRKFPAEEKIRIVMEGIRAEVSVADLCRRDVKLDPLVEVLEGKRYVHAHCYRADEILMLIRVANEFGFKVRTFQHVLEGYKIAEEIAKYGAGGSTFSDSWAFKMEAYDGIPYNAAVMTERGVIVSINSDSAEAVSPDDFHRGDK